MPTEIVLTGENRVETTTLTEVASHVTGGVSVEFRGGELWALVDERGDRVLTMFASKRIEMADGAARVLGHEVAEGSWWTSIAVPFGREEPGRSVALGIAEATSSTATVLS